MHHFGLIALLFLFLLGALLGTPFLLVILASLALGAIVFGVGVWSLDYFSAGARAERAARAGRIGDALAHYARCGNERQSLELLSARLPLWPDARRALRSAFHELAALENLLNRTRTVGVARGLLDPLSRETAVAANVLRGLANRLGAAGASEGDSGGIQDSLDRAVAHVDQIAAALRAAQLGLIELTLLAESEIDSGRDVAAACARLRALGDAARELAFMERRP